MLATGMLLLRRMSAARNAFGDQGSLFSRA